MDKKSKGALLVILFVLVITILFAVLRSANQRSNWRLAEFAKAHGAEYASMATLDEASGGAYIKGKVMVLDIGESIGDNAIAEPFKPKLNALSEVHGMIGRLRADKPEEIGTVVLLKWSGERAGTYSDASLAYRSSCESIIIDVDRRAVVDRVFFVGGDPPRSHVQYRSKSGERIWGKAPSRHDISAYIKGLPKR